jgi:coiled-coil domain-containing protein 77
MQSNTTLIISYTSLKRRRIYEIEGFTTDIINLRNQIRTLEKNILKYGALEERELVLLDLARSTGEKAGKITKELQSLKTKTYMVEQEVQGLEF